MNLKLLLVEDSPDDVFFFKRTLGKCGFSGELIWAEGGIEAVEKLTALAAQAALPDLIFLDLKLPSFSGFEVLNWIRQQQFSPPLRVVVLSGSDQTTDLQHSLKLGAIAYLVKPLRSASLQPFLSQILSHAQQKMDAANVHADA
jgi:CheY-like chemotaxis protein